MIWKSIFIEMVLVSVPLCAIAQEPLKRDTVRTELQSEFIEEIGDSTDLVVASDGTSNWFISFSGGVNSLAAEANRAYDSFIDRSRFSFRLSSGKWFSPVWGFRMQMGIGKLSGHSQLHKFYNIYDDLDDHSSIPNEMQPYISEEGEKTWFHRKFTYMDWSVSLMTDAVRWFAKEQKPIGVVLFAGPGFSHGLNSQGLSASNSFTLNAGIQLNVNLNKHWDIFAEFQGNIVDETFDGQIGGTDNERNRTLEGYAGLNIGITYKFGGKKFSRYAKIHPVTYESVRYYEPPKTIEVSNNAQEEDVTAFTVRFFVDKSNIEDDQKLNIERIARYLKSHPSTKLELTGYADKETSYPEYNMRLSQRRVDTVRDYLVKECGIDPSCLILDAKGDTQRVYEEDFRWNRVVIMKIIENDK